MLLSQQEEGQGSPPVKTISKELRNRHSSQETRQIYVFGEYRLDSQDRRLWHRETPVLLAPKALDLLHAFLQRPGQLITKEELLRTIWPSSFVEEANLTVYVSALRKAFGKIDPTVEFIETIPKWGYRFTAQVTQECAETEAISSEESAEIEVDANDEHGETIPTPSPAFRSKYLWLSLVLLVAIVFGVVLLRPGRTVRASTVLANSRALAGSRPLTGPTGIFSQPAFSPDGAKLAYTWRTTTEDEPSIYIQSINSNDRTRITNSTGRDLSPAWSPDGRQLAYFHFEKDSAPLQLILVDLARPSVRRQTASVGGFTSAFRIAPSLGWSKDGKWLLTTDREDENDTPSLVLIDPATGHKRRLTHAPPRSVDDNATFSPDGTLVAFRRSFGSSLDDVFVIAVNGGDARRLAFEKHCIIDGLAWNPDGQSVIVSSGLATSVGSLWRLPIDGSGPVPITAPLIHTSSPAVSAQARRLAYVDRLQNVSTWKMSTDGRSKAAQFIASSFLDSAADYSPDGNYIAFRSDRSGANEVWICRSDGTGLKKVTSFNGPMTGSPRWSPDGQWLAFDSRAAERADIYLLKISGGPPVRFTTGGASDSDNVVPNWSADGRSIYFSSNRTGTWQIWRKTIATSSEEQVTQSGGFNGIESPDARYLYYVRDADKTSIWRLPLNGTRQDEEIVKELGPGMWGYWTLAGENMYYLRRPSSGDPQASIFRLNLRTNHAEALGTTQYAVNHSDKGLSVSPDGRWLLYAQRDVDRSNIMLTEGWE